MKKISLCIVLFAGTAINIQGQEMSEFAPIGAEWWYSGYRYLTEEEPLPEIYVAEKYVHYKCSEDVVFAGKNCRRIDRTIYTRTNIAASFSPNVASPKSPNAMAFNSCPSIEIVVMLSTTTLKVLLPVVKG